MDRDADVPQGFYRAILEDLRDVVFRMDHKGRWEFLNPAWTEITGFEVADSLDRAFLEFIHPDDREHLRGEFEALAVAEKSSCNQEARCLTSDGGTSWVVFHARCVRGNDGKMVGVIGTLRDITQRKELEATLNREKERAQITLRSIGEGVIVTGPDDRIQLLNPEGERLLGWSTEAAQGCPLVEVFRITDEAGRLLLTVPPGCSSDPHNKSSPGVNAWLDRAAGEQMAVEWSAAPVTASGETDLGCVVVFRDVTAQRTLQQQLAYQATHDALTGVLNRAALQEAIAHQAAWAERYGQSFSLILLDLDRFKIANDNYGHNAGDKILAAMAERIPPHIREADWFGRWGGEEFLCLLPGASSNEAVAIAERIRGDIMGHPVTLEEAAIPVTASLGVAAFPEDCRGTEDLMRTADTRLYEAKRAGRNRVEAGGGGDSQILPMGGRLQRALEEDRILPAYQAIVDLHSGEQVAEEALSRLLETNNEVMAAGQFIEAASDLQMVHRIDEVLLTRTMQRCSEMLLAGHQMNHFVNISTDLLRHRELVDSILHRALKICEQCASQMGKDKPLIIEITEREFMDDTREVNRILQPFLDYGFRIAVDDFGSGYSSFRYLADLPVSVLKIEGELVRRATREPRVQAILRGIRDIAGELELTTVAEMVEDEETADFLREIGIDLAQGFHFAYPALVSERSIA